MYDSLSQAPSRPRLPVALALTLVTLGLFAALAVFGARVHWVEEVGTAERDGFVAKAETLLGGHLPIDPFRPLLYPLLTAGLTQLGPSPFTAARLLSNAAAVTLVLLAWGFGRRLGGARLGALAAAATAVNPNLWILGQHVTTDMLFAALAGGSLLAAFAYLERPRVSTAVLAGALLGAAAFTRGNAVFLLPGLLVVHVLAPRRARESAGESRRNRWRDGLLAVAAAMLVLLPHWALRAAVFGEPFHDENWKNLAWKLHGYPDWSYLDRIPFSGPWEVVSNDPLGVVRGGFSELGRFFFGGGLSQLLGTPLHALLLLAGVLVALRFSPRATGWLVGSLGAFLLALAFAFFTWGRLLLLLLPPANALAFACLAGEPAVELRRRLSRKLRQSFRGLPPWLSSETGLRRLAVAAALALVALLAVKTFFFRLPAFIAHHPYGEVATLRRLDRDLPPGTALAGVTPFLGRYLEHPYLAVPDAFGPEIERPELWLAKVRPLLRAAGVRYLVVDGIDLRDRPRSLAPSSPPLRSPAAVPWLRPISFDDGVAVWRVDAE